MSLAQKHHMHGNYEEVRAFLEQWGALLAYVVVGLLGKLGWDIVNGNTLKKSYILGTTLISFCIGFLSWEWCKSHPTYNPGIIVTASALISRDVMLFITMIDWQGVLKLITGKSTKDNKNQ